MSTTQSSFGVSPFAKPLASRELTEQLYEIIKEASMYEMVAKGKKEIIACIRTRKPGFAVFAADITPIDILRQLATVCERNSIPYAYVISDRGQDLGLATGGEDPVSCVMVKPFRNYQETYDQRYNDLSSLTC